MSVHFKKLQGSSTAIGNPVLVTHMDFGEQKTAGVRFNYDPYDDGQTRGIYPLG